MSIKQTHTKKAYKPVPIALSVFEFFIKKRENVSNGLRDGQDDRGLCSFFARFCIFLSLLAPLSLFAPCAQETIIVLAPYADPRSPGRTINGQFERGIALQCAEKLKTELEQRVPHATVIIAKPASVETTALATASFANTLGASYFFALSFYQETSPHPHVHLYRYTRETDLPLNNTELAFYPYDHIYRLRVNDSITLAKNLCTSFSTQHDSVCTQPCALPLKTLVGIAAPAVALEIGIPHDYAWQQLIEPLATGIAHALTN